MTYTIFFCKYSEVSKRTYRNVKNIKKKHGVYNTACSKEEKESLKMIGAYIVIDEIKRHTFL